VHSGNFVIQVDLHHGSQTATMIGFGILLIL
jgi:hypothetical protein